MTTGIVTLYAGEAADENVRLYPLPFPVTPYASPIVIIRMLELMPDLRGACAISGVTRLGSGTVCGGCRVDLYLAGTKLLVGTTISDEATGVYSFPGLTNAKQFYAVAYKDGVPDLAGTTLNELVAA
jgi:hypothetical protein